MIQTTVYYDECFQDHVSTLDYPECSDRVKNIIDLITVSYTHLTLPTKRIV